MSAGSATGGASAAWGYLSEYERGVLDALRVALLALDGHGFRDTADDRLRRLLACGECDHQPHLHGPDGVCMERVLHGRGVLDACHCIEWEPKPLPLATGDSGKPA